MSAKLSNSLVGGGDVARGGQRRTKKKAVECVQAGDSLFRRRPVVQASLFPGLVAEQSRSPALRTSTHGPHHSTSATAAPSHTRLKRLCRRVTNVGSQSSSADTADSSRKVQPTAKGPCKEAEGKTWVGTFVVTAGSWYCRHVASNRRPGAPEASSVKRKTIWALKDRALSTKQNWGMRETEGGREASGERRARLGMQHAPPPPQLLCGAGTGGTGDLLLHRAVSRQARHTGGPGAQDKAVGGQTQLHET